MVALVVENDEKYLGMLICTLQERGYKVLIALNPQQALEKLTEDSSISLIFWGATVSEAETWEAIVKVRKLTQANMVITVGLGERHVQIGNDIFFPKPFTRGELQGLLSERF